MSLQLVLPATVTKHGHELQVGDRIIGSGGRAREVVSINPVTNSIGPLQNYFIQFADNLPEIGAAAITNASREWEIA